MIDYEVSVFDTVYPIIAPLCAPGKFVSTNITSSTAYPAVSLVEVTNVTVRSRQSSSQTENFADVMYQLDVYAKGKYNAKAVYVEADRAMTGIGFTRVSGTWLDNADAPEVSRYTARYRAWIDPNGVIYRAP